MLQNLPSLRTIKKYLIDSHKAFGYIYNYLWYIIPIHCFVVYFLARITSWFDKKCFGFFVSRISSEYHLLCCYIYSYVLVISSLAMFAYYIIHILYPQLEQNKLKKITAFAVQERKKTRIQKSKKNS